MVAEEKNASAVFGEIRQTMAEGLSLRGSRGVEIAVGNVSKRSKIQELRDVEDVVMLMSPGKARNVLLADLRRLRDDVMDKLVMSDD